MGQGFDYVYSIVWEWEKSKGGGGHPLASLRLATPLMNEGGEVCGGVKNVIARGECSLR